MNDSEKITNILIEAAGRIERDGWIQNHMINFETGKEMCAFTAITISADWVEVTATADHGYYLRQVGGRKTLSLVEEASNRLTRHLIRHGLVNAKLFDGTELIGRWNDTPGNTKENVIKALRDAATDFGPTSI